MVPKNDATHGIGLSHNKKNNKYFVLATDKEFLRASHLIPATFGTLIVDKHYGITIVKRVLFLLWVLGTMYI